MRAFVTGSTGFIGSQLTALLRAHGWQVRGLMRPGRDPARLRALGAEGVFGTLEDLPVLVRACEGCDVVFHVAAALGPGTDVQTLFRVNVDGTENVLRAASSARVGRVVFTSSVAVYGEAAPEGADEDTPPHPSGPYGESKVRAEALCRRYMEERGLAVTILRPCFVYGPEDPYFLPTAVSILRGGWFPVVEGGRLPVDLVHVEDVAKAHLLAATVPQAAGRAYNITDGRRRSLRSLVELGARALGVRVRLVPVPRFLARPGAVVLRALGELLRVPGRELLTPDNLQAMCAPHHFSIARARRELGYEPTRQVEEVLPVLLREFAGS
ncbi:MAG: NAD-dependent epimerase/dehydratase family protein [Armatimonadetes bacterium]|nr:NAD-dependent epimerase/dehydratase family protein [Armatimonadota bacterium]MDW8154770.1 NAD-dependent epimerase/dehydratase family protein [Armatimonadota bacterium]